MRADRLISILMILKNKEKVTTKELAYELEVTDRTIHRDMEALAQAGIPVYAERGKDGGWRLLNKWSTQLNWLKHDELQSLLLSSSNKILEDLGLKQSSSDAKKKLLTSIGTNNIVNAKHISEKIYIDTSSWKNPKQTPLFLQLIKQAVFEERKLQIIYEKYNSDRDQRIIEPLGLVVKGDN